jgi:hypothetical protein
MPVVASILPLTALPSIIDVGLPIIGSSCELDATLSPGDTKPTRKPRTKTIECRSCQKLHGRNPRAEICENKHNGVLGYPCNGGGSCPNPNWYCLMRDLVR